MGGPPALADVRAAYQPSDVPLLDRHGEVIHELRIDPSRRRLDWTSLADISPALQAAVSASEDRRFYAHSGVDVRALLAAALRRAIGAPLRGASTRKAIHMKATSLTRCPNCGSRKIRRLAKPFRARVGTRVVAIPSLAREVCPDCGEEFFDRDANILIDEHCFGKARNRA